MRHWRDTHRRAAARVHTKNHARRALYARSREPRRFALIVVVSLIEQSVLGPLSNPVCAGVFLYTLSPRLPSVQQESAASSSGDGSTVRCNSHRSPDEGGRVGVDEQARIGRRQPLRAELRDAPEREAEAQRQAGGRL